MTKKVFITGVGMTTPLGVGRENFFSRLINGETGLTGIESFDTSDLSCHLGGEVRDFNARDFISVRSLRKMDRISSLVAASSRMALEDAGLVVDDNNRDRIGIILGVSYGSVETSVKLATTIFTEGPRLANPILVPNVVMNAPAGHTSIELGLRGVNSTVNHNAASGETAVAYAASLLGLGRAEAILAGGTDGLSRFFYETLIRFMALSGSRGGEEGARPFDRSANGFVMAEGSGVVLLETEDSIKARNAKPYAQVLGWGLSSSPAPLNDWPEDPKGAVLAIRRALESAETRPEEIDFVCASANGSPRFDALEATALAQVFSGSDGPLVTSLKGAVGESFSSGGLRTAAAALSLSEGVVPPTLGLIEPRTGLNFVTQEKITKNMNKALITGLSFGGTYAALVLGKGDKE